MTRTTLSALSLASALTLSLAAYAAPADFSITLTGQAMLRADLRAVSPATVAAMAPLITGDVRFTDFEATVGAPGDAKAAGRNVSPPAALDALHAMGFNLVALATNHAFDNGAAGILHTLAQADKLGLAHAGTGATLDRAAAAGLLRTSKGTVALVAMASGLMAEGAMAGNGTPGVNELRIEAGGKVNQAANRDDFPPGIVNAPNAGDSARILGAIAAARKTADFVIVYHHNHVFGHLPFRTLFAEELPERLAPPDWVRAWAHAEVDAGADMVVMHGAPLLHGVEIYKGKPVFYDLGNFIFNYPTTEAQAYLDEPIVWESVVAHANFQGRTLTSLSFQPIAMNKIGEGQPDLKDGLANTLYLQTRGLPKPVTGKQAGFILERLAEASKPFGTTITVNGDTAVWKIAAP
ncbi:MAG: CapA family protein [Rhodospirillaceae bacterium]